MPDKKKYVSENTLAEHMQAERERRKIPYEIIFGILTFCLTVGGWVWYASRLTTHNQVKQIVSEQLKQYTPKTQYIRLKTRVELTEQQNREWRKEVKQSLGEIKRTLKDLSLRIPNDYRSRNHQRRRRQR